MRTGRNSGERRRDCTRYLGAFAPIGAVVSGVVGGVIGGLVGHYLGEEAGNLANDAIVDPLNER